MAIGKHSNLPIPETEVILDLANQEQTSRYYAVIATLLPGPNPLKVKVGRCKSNNSSRHLRNRIHEIPVP